MFGVGYLITFIEPPINYFTCIFVVMRAERWSLMLY